jgi:hypothetical protein
MPGPDGTGHSTLGESETPELIPRRQDESQLSPADPIFKGLSDAQKTLIERARAGEAREWWRRDELDDALQKIDRTWPKRKRQAAFDQIRGVGVPGWIYKSVGKRSAYLLELFQAEPTLPKEFRATVEELSRADDSRIRARILQAIDMAIEDYRAVRARDPFDPSQVPPFRNAKEGERWLHSRGLAREEELRRLLDPYVAAVDSMLSAIIPDEHDELRWLRWQLTHSQTVREIASAKARGLKVRDSSHQLVAFQFARLGYQWLLTVRARLENRNGEYSNK